MPEKKILIIDDHTELLRGLERAFSSRGYQVDTAADGPAGLDQFLNHRPDAVVLDIMLPTLDGREICREMRRRSDVPILLITGQGSEEDYIDSLQAGADDYLLKPFRLEMLIAKVEALLRRAGLPAGPNGLHFYGDDYLTIDLVGCEVFVRGQPVPLRPREYQLLAYLVQRAGQIVSHEQILWDLWGWAGQEYTRLIHLYIGRLRQRLEVDPRQPRYLVTVPRRGYRFKKQTSS